MISVMNQFCIVSLVTFPTFYLFCYSLLHSKPPKPMRSESTFTNEEVKYCILSLIHIHVHRVLMY